MRSLVLLLLTFACLATPGYAKDAHRHHLLIHVDSADKEVMVEALHNATNAIDTVRKQGGQVDVEIVANGFGTAMFVTDLSPVADEVRRIKTSYPALAMSACAISLVHIEASMKKPHTVLPQARTVPSGAVRIMELEEQGWPYLKP